MSSIENEEVNTKISLSPNPSNDYVRIDYTSKINNIIVYNSVGENVKTFDAHNVNVVLLPIPDLAEGMYILQIDGKASQRFIKSPTN